MAPVNGQSLLEVRDLEVTFETSGGTLRAVDGVSYDLAPGRTLGVVGESGGGKSMTALAILRLVPEQGRITGGRVVFEGEELTGLAEAGMEAVRGNRIAMIFQEPMTSLNPVVTIGEQIAEVYLIHRKATRKEALGEAVELLAKVRIPDPAARAMDYPHQMSGGMRQRAMIAMALACRPALLIADEPTTALDVTIQAQILELMLEIQDEMGMAIQFISHNLGVISEV
ncbi:MAG: ABC transporter ATP-binding protein, partial [Proteobacteria bacterium]|nr:ABC transporter ATP-binding protein [Pseudomonadota bacterium]